MIDEHPGVLHGYSEVRKRHTFLAFEQADEIERLRAEVMRLRASIIVRDTRLAMLREEIAAGRHQGVGARSCSKV